MGIHVTNKVHLVVNMISKQFRIDELREKLWKDKEDAYVKKKEAKSQAAKSAPLSEPLITSSFAKPLSPTERSHRRMKCDAWR